MQGWRRPSDPIPKPQTRDFNGSRAKGNRNEERALAFATMFAAEWCTWIVSVRAGTLAEDHVGIDLVVTTDAGVIVVQVKSAQKEARQFRKRWRERGRTEPLVVVVFNRERPERQVRDRFFDDLSAVHDSLLVRRSSAS